LWAISEKLAKKGLTRIVYSKRAGLKIVPSSGCYMVVGPIGTLGEVNLVAPPLRLHPVSYGPKRERYARFILLK
jgi:hypothetical protein